MTKLATCHPDRKAYSKGLCQSCWTQQYRSPSSCHPDRPYGTVIQYGVDICSICLTVLQPGTGKSAIDHDHHTGRVRGLLCGSCNKMLGFAKDNVETLRKAISYLERPWLKEVVNGS